MALIQLCGIVQNHKKGMNFVSDEFEQTGSNNKPLCQSIGLSAGYSTTMLPLLLGQELSIQQQAIMLIIQTG